MTDYDRGYTQDLLEQKVSEQQATIADLQGQLEAAKKKVAGYDRWLSGGVYYTNAEFEEQINDRVNVRNERAALKQRVAQLECEVADLQVQVDQANDRADRLMKDRRDLLDVKTTEGMSCSEWVMRTAKAERAAKDLQQRVAQLEQERDAFESHAIDLQADHARVLGLLAQVTEIADMMLKGTECEHDVGLCSCEHRRIVKQAQRSLPAQRAKLAQGGV